MDAAGIERELRAHLSPRAKARRRVCSLDASEGGHGCRGTRAGEEIAARELASRAYAPAAVATYSETASIC